jgi:16S rRNA processing protein RimM
MAEPATLAFGVVGRPHGIRGEVILRPYDADSSSLADAQLPIEVWLQQGDRRIASTIETLRPAAREILVRFAGCTSRDEAARLTHAILHVPRTALRALAEDEYFVEDLVGMQVRDLEGRIRGAIVDVYWNGAHDVLVIRDPLARDAEDWLVPAVPEFLREVDVVARAVVVDPHE